MTEAMVTRLSIYTLFAFLFMIAGALDHARASYWDGCGKTIDGQETVLEAPGGFYLSVLGEPTP